jgi:hypothetical protein
MATSYRHTLEKVLPPETERFNYATWFQQDSTTLHTAQICMENMHEMFHHHLISESGDLNWQSISPDLLALIILVGLPEELHTHMAYHFGRNQGQHQTSDSSYTPMKYYNS